MGKTSRYNTNVSHLQVFEYVANSGSTLSSTVEANGGGGIFRVQLLARSDTGCRVILIIINDAAPIAFL